MVYGISIDTNARPTCLIVVALLEEQAHHGPFSRSLGHVAQVVPSKDAEIRHAYPLTDAVEANALTGSLHGSNPGTRNKLPGRKKKYTVYNRSFHKYNGVLYQRTGDNTV